MKKIIKPAVFAFILSMLTAYALTAQNGKENDVMQKIKISFGKNEITAHIYDSQAAKYFLQMLPANLSFDDYNSVEKTAKLPEKLPVSEEKFSHTFSEGDIAYYAPWNNIVLFYKDFKYQGEGIVKIGKMTSGWEKLRNMPGEYNIKIEKVN